MQAIRVSGENFHRESGRLDRTVGLADARHPRKGVRRDRLLDATAMLADCVATSVPAHARAFAAWLAKLGEAQPPACALATEPNYRA